MKRQWMLIPLAVILVAGCARVKVEPIEVKPIHITLDINLRIDRALDDALKFEDALLPVSTPSTQPK
jgi:hypothetical protein